MIGVPVIGGHILMVHQRLGCLMYVIATFRGLSVVSDVGRVAK